MSNPTKDKLNARGYRLTPQRMAVLRILDNAGEHLSALQICQLAQDELPGITEATVYRTLSFLTEQGLILAAHMGNGQLVYESAMHAHHHLVCRACGSCQAIEHAVLKNLYQHLHDATGFQVDRVHITFFGLCPQCQRQEIC